MKDLMFDILTIFLLVAIAICLFGSGINAERQTIKDSCLIDHGFVINENEYTCNLVGDKKQ